jgi:hypothetical protein
MMRAMHARIRHPGTAAIVLLLAAAGGCAEDPEIAARIAAIHARGSGVFEPRGDEQLALGLVSGATRWCPSSTPAAQLRATVRRGPLLITTSARRAAGAPPDPHEGLSFAEFALSMSPGSLSPDWVLTPPGQLTQLLAPSPAIDIAAHLVRKPAVATTLRLGLTFDCDQQAAFSGRPGRAGVNAGPGEDGEAGLDVVFSVAYAQPAPGQKVVVVKAVPSAGPATYFVLAPGRRLTVEIRGGDGGAGGEPLEVGLGFTGGLGGDGGNGGRSLIRFDGRHPELRALFDIVNPGGRGGEGGAGKASAGRPGRPGAAHYESADAEAMFADEIAAGAPVVKSVRAGSTNTI